MNSELFVAYCISVLASVQDIAQHRISNHLTYPAMIAGVAWHSWPGSWHGFAEAGLGILIPFVVLLPVFLAGGFGAGDVKLFMAIGSWLGPRSVTNVLLLSLFCNGVASAAVLMARHSPSILTRARLWVIGMLLNRLGIGIRHRRPESGPTRREKPTEAIPLAVMVLIGMILVFHFRLGIL